MHPKHNTMTTEDYRRLDHAHHFHPFEDHAALHAQGVRTIVKADGVYIYDSDGNKILDGMAGLWCVNVGYGREEIAEAVAEQMRQLPYYNTFFKTTHPPVVALAEKIASLAPEGMDHVFFTGSGSESSDTIMRLLRTYWAAKGESERQVIITRHNAYHGSTMAGASLGGMSAMHGQGGLPIPGVHHITQPYWWREGGEASPEDFGAAAAEALETAIRSIGAEKIAGFMAEPIQGAGGVIIPPESYWPKIESICRKHGIMLVSDEVICGFGRVGEWFGCQSFGYQPDVISIAKGMTSGYLPMGGVIISGEIADVLMNQAGEFYHGYTYSGHPAAAAAAIANLDIMIQENLIGKVHEKTGPYFEKAWRSLGDHPLVGEVRVRGLIGGLELTPDRARRARFDPEGEMGALCRDFAIQEGLVSRAVRDSMVISPPLVISEAEIDELVMKLSKALDLAEAEGKKRGYFK